MDDIEIIFKSLEYAADRHRNQFRKGEEKTPYINHPIQVANLLVNEAGEKDAVLISAAILHDVVEDTVSSVEERDDLTNHISVIFGEKVLSLILEVTDDKTLEKKLRKQIQIEEAPYKSERAKKLKIADKIMNVRDIISNPPAGWPLERIVDYLNWSETVVNVVSIVFKF
jgi:guanosine-3',5'-bis(diphosphate) 3'-pyrophosphohydrolase